MQDEPLVSIVIPTSNSERFLEQCSISIEQQTYGNIESIIIDNYSTDRTEQIAIEHEARILQVKSERARAKNCGAKEANGKYVFFLDSDMELQPRVVEECVGILESDATIGGLTIPERSIGNSYWVKVRDFERSFYSKTEVESARFFKKDLVLLVDGFDEEIEFYEENTLPQKIEGLQFNIKNCVKSFILHHEEDFKLRSWLRKKYYYGRTAGLYLKHSTRKLQINIFYRVRLFFENRRFLAHPNLAFGVFALKFLEYICVTTGSWRMHIENREKGTPTNPK
jgi:glycosyltransferase involved in cell wall biosynthesis